MVGRGGSSVIANTIYRVIQRADELSEIVALYWKDGKKPLSAQLKKGLAQAFTKFNEYQLAKYDRAGAVRLRDVMFLTHPKPTVQTDLWSRLANEQLATPDTWEVGLSTGGTKKDTFERLLEEGKLGQMALIRNLRNMHGAKVDTKLVFSALRDGAGKAKVLPFRYVSAAEHVPAWEPAIEEAMMLSLGQMAKLPGRTAVVVDVSGSMYQETVSGRSKINRAKVAATLGAMAREVCEEPLIYATAGNDHTMVHQTKLVPARRGFALIDAIYGLCRPLGGGGIFLAQVMDYIHEQEGSVDRVIVITDEQDTDQRRDPTMARLIGDNNYLINVASYKNGIGYKKWTHIDGWSEAVIDYIRASETVSQ